MGAYGDPINWTPTYADSSSYWSSSATSVVTYPFYPQAYVPEPPKPPTAREWLDARIDEIVSIGRKEVVFA